MRRFGVFLSMVIVILLGIVVCGLQPGAVAQEATPAAGEFTEEGITFEPLALATELALPASGELSISRVSFDPGAGVPIDEGDPSYALAVIESGELTVRQDGPLVVMRAGALAAAMNEAMAGGTSGPVSEAIASGQEVTLQAGDTVLFPPNAAGEIRNDSQERTVVLVAFVGPPAPEGTPTP